MAYVLENSARDVSRLSYLPKECVLPKTSEKVVLGVYDAKLDYESLYETVKYAIDEGRAYPEEFIDKELFSHYLSRNVFVARSNGSLVGAFFVKPNFPGRSSHICNGGFVVHRDHRNKGVGEFLYRSFLRIARDLGYEGSFFNIVYANNVGSLRICRKLGFVEVGVIPRAGRMKGLGYVDAHQFYYDLTSLDASDSK